MTGRLGDGEMGRLGDWDDFDDWDDEETGDWRLRTGDRKNANKRSFPGFYPERVKYQ